ncbi:hypothetical protein BH23ACT11_BH23ACT11_20990 [soil metagenome]
MPPEWVQTVRIRSESQDKYIDYMVCQDEVTLLYMANLGCIEINPWSSRVSALDHPDYLVLDLDPVEVPFEDVIACALKAREILQGIDVPCYCKTSGGRGLHVAVPPGTR